MDFCDLPEEDVRYCGNLPPPVASYRAAEDELRAKGWAYLIQYDAWVSPAGLKALYPTAKLAKVK